MGAVVTLHVHPHMLLICQVQGAMGAVVSLHVHPHMLSSVKYRELWVQLYHCMPTLTCCIICQVQGAMGAVVSLHAHPHMLHHLSSTGSYGCSCITACPPSHVAVVSSVKYLSSIGSYGCSCNTACPPSHVASSVKYRELWVQLYHCMPTLTCCIICQVQGAMGAVVTLHAHPHMLHHLSSTGSYGCSCNTACPPSHVASSVKYRELWVQLYHCMSTLTCCFICQV